MPVNPWHMRHVTVRATVALESATSIESAGSVASGKSAPPPGSLFPARYNYKLQTQGSWRSRMHAHNLPGRGALSELNALEPELYTDPEWFGNPTNATWV